MPRDDVPPARRPDPETARTMRLVRRSIVVAWMLVAVAVIGAALWYLDARAERQHEREREQRREQQRYEQELMDLEQQRQAVRARIQEAERRRQSQEGKVAP